MPIASALAIVLRLPRTLGDALPTLIAPLLGAIGWFGPGDTMHTNIAIRTLVYRGGRVRANAGGGVTALSDPHTEWRETLAKMAGLERALQCRCEIPEEPA